MNYKILSIKKRPWWTRLLADIDHWEVTIETEDKRILKFNCWAGLDRHSPSSLLSDLSEKLKVRQEPNPLNKLIGKQFSSSRYYYDFEV